VCLEAQGQEQVQAQGESPELVQLELPVYQGQAAPERPLLLVPQAWVRERRSQIVRHQTKLSRCPLLQPDLNWQVRQGYSILNSF
jgi:hypothetical protein